MNRIWERAEAGKSSAVVGGLVGRPPLGCSVLTVRVSGDRPHGTPLAPLLEAQEKVRHLLGTAEPVDAGVERAPGPRARMLGHGSGANGEAGIVDTLNQLGSAAGRPCAILLDDVSAADPATLQLLKRVFARPGWLTTPLVLSFREAHPEGASAELVDALMRRDGLDAIFRVEPEQAVRSFEAELPAPILLVLRAGAVIGSGFESSLVAALLGISNLEVLTRVQVAVDMGFPIEDLGDGRFHLPDAVVTHLRGRTLPSLVQTWHLALGGLLSREVASRGASSTVDVEAVPERVSAQADERRSPSARVPSPLPSSGVSAQEPPATSRATPGEAMMDGPASPTAEEAIPGSSASPTPTNAPPMAPAASTESDPAERHGESAASRRPHAATAARAAAHLQAAGESEQAAQYYLEAARQAATAGAPLQAVTFDRQALELIESLPATPPRRMLRIRILLDLARYQWEAAGPGAEFTLEGALATGYEAEALLDAHDPPQLMAELWQTLAGIHYDIGHQESLENALEYLTRAVRRLHDSRDSYAAARLLNDQAAVLVRLGDPVRAHHLLQESRRVFEDRTSTDSTALVELAETDLLLARLPLHVAARPGREKDAIDMALEHAAAAERAYGQLELVREQARAWETLGRLERLHGRLDRAAHWLRQALEMQQRVGDVIGLARSAEALAKLQASQGHFADALGLLGDSLTLNLEKGTHMGVAYLRETLRELREEMPEAALTQLSPAIEDLEHRLAAAHEALQDR